MVFVFWMSVFLFFKQKTAYEMRISDWSSDVCSSDLSRYRLRATPSRTARRLHSKVMNSTTLNRKCRTGVCHLEEKQQQGEYFLAMVIQNVIVTQRRLPICRTHPFPSPHASLNRPPSTTFASRAFGYSSSVDHSDI